MLQSITVLVLLSWVAATHAASFGDDVVALHESVQAYSLTGKALVSPPPDRHALEKLNTARIEYDKDPTDADNIIWYGRRTAYTGDYRGAIHIFSEGIRRHPRDARLYRHRGHRYISVREFDRAIEDLEYAARLIEGEENRIEPDGMPNALNIPVSTLHGNIWYHLGLAWYLKHDWEKAYRAFQAGFDTGGNDDNRVSTTHWRYMILRRMGRAGEAERTLDDISADMNVIENMVYHRLCLFYKGQVPLVEMAAKDADNPTGAAGAYGVANWFLYNGDLAEATHGSAHEYRGLGFVRLHCGRSGPGHDGKSGVQRCVKVRNGIVASKPSTPHIVLCVVFTRHSYSSQEIQPRFIVTVL
jgi:tetratricopeptide (TPR) repeat protein